MTADIGRAANESESSLWAVCAGVVQLFKPILCFGNEAPQFGLHAGVYSKA
jgi:hypothetical protein